MEFFASASPGTEYALLEELRDLGFRGTRRIPGGVPFGGSMSDGAYACLHSRIAQRILCQLARFDCANEDELYAGALACEWAPHISPDTTIAVSAYTAESAVENSMYASVRVKDAIADQLRKATGSRPDVDRNDPDVRVFLHLWRDRATLYLDLSGAPLFQRGYRRVGGEAPLKETLAAAILRMSGWDTQTPLIDPMCGSGTIAIEAALWATNSAPGILRERFGFERWASHSEETAEGMRNLRGEARRKCRGTRPRIIASDVDPEALEAARENARVAGVRLTFREADVRKLQAGEGRFIVTNPPYDVRMAAEPRFFQQLGASLMKQRGCTATLLAGTPLLRKCIPLEPTRANRIRNGPLPCEVLTYRID